MRVGNAAIVMLVAVLMAMPSLVLADTFIKSAFHQDAMKMGPQTTPARDDTSTTWMGDNVAVMHEGETSSMLVNGKTGMIYMIDHEKKSYTEMPVDALGDIEKMLAGSGADEDEAAMMKQQMQAMMAMMKMEVKVTPTEETKEIRGWGCKKYEVDTKMGMGNMKSVAWVTKDVELDYSMFAKLMSAPMMQMPGFQDALKEMEKMDGLQVLMEITISAMGTEVKSKKEVLAIESKDAPEGTYDVPKDYKKEKYEFEMGM